MHEMEEIGILPNLSKYMVIPGRAQYELIIFQEGVVASISSRHILVSVSHILISKREYSIFTAFLKRLSVA